VPRRDVDTSTPQQGNLGGLQHRQGMP